MEPAEANFAIELVYNWDRDTPYEGGDRFGHFAFWVDDLDDIYRRLVAAGAQEVGRPPAPLEGKRPAHRLRGRPRRHLGRADRTRRMSATARERQDGGGRTSGEAPPPYTVVNLKQVENMAPKFGLSPGLESRFARVPLELRSSGLSYFRIAPGFRTPFGHHHLDQEEIYLVVSGSARAKLDDEVDRACAPGMRCGWRPTRCAPSRAAPRAPRSSPSARRATRTATSQVVQGWWTD